MKKRDILQVLAVLCIGCGTNNEIVVANQAGESVSFQFRAESLLVVPGETKSITGIPNGSYAYSTIFTIPFDVNGGDADKEAGGWMSFTTSGTKTRISYTSTITRSDTIYHLHAVLTSSDRNDVGPLSTQSSE